ncbi:MAG: penicillin acylase family protein [Anaerolineae bacterium]|nr:penicillin acylase family protein [Anaerolineae bacterium]
MRRFWLILAVCLVLAPMRPRPSQADAAPALTLPGLQAEVTVQVDAFGVPHIYATTAHDLVLAQGYLHARDRWWQMEWARRTARGRRQRSLGQITPSRTASSAR